MMPVTIFTLEARDNIFLELLKGSYNCDYDIINETINSSFNQCISILAKKGINYLDLKNCLVPSIDKNEIAFVFDRTKIESSTYGVDVFSKLIPLFNKESSHSVLAGDYTGDEKRKERLKSAFFDHIKTDKQIEYIYHNQFYIVYINNLTYNMVNSIIYGLKNYNAYVGYFDLTYSSFLKTYLSFHLINLFIKNKKNIILSESEEYYNEDDSKGSIYPFEENGFKYKSIQSFYFALFLSYKIERNVYPEFEGDTSFAISAITKNVLDIYEFKVLVEKDKLAYLLEAKRDNFERAGLIDLNLEELELVIKYKMRDNYIYNLTYLKQYETLKFNIIIETKRVDKDKLIKLLAGLEYKPSDKTLRLITMF